MTLLVKHRQAIELRKLGKTYSEIKNELNVPKSTLSNWLKDIDLSDKQLAELTRFIKKKKFLAVEKTRKTKQLKRGLRLKNIYNQEKNTLLPLSKKELFVSGLFLYWGEGNKHLQSAVSINNTDPQVLKFSLYWLTQGLDVPKEKIKVFLHLYSDMDKEKELAFWSSELNLPLSQFNNPYIKETKRADLDQKGFGHGTCGLSVNDVRLKEKIILGIKSIADYYSEKL